MRWLIAGAALTVAVLVFLVCRHYLRGNEADPPGVIFERSDRPARV